jgi:hypothetical protein
MLSYYCKLDYDNPVYEFDRFTNQNQYACVIGSVIFFNLLFFLDFIL